MKRAALAAALVALAVAPVAAGQPARGPIHRDVLDAAREVSSANGPAVYAAQRELWRAWDRGDPTQVEEAIRGIVDDPKTSPPARAYAQLLAAYARRRRGDLDGAVARIDALGFVGRWATVGPFDNENKAGFAITYPPEDDPSAAPTRLAVFEGKDRPVHWRVPPDESRYGWTDFGEGMRPRERICAYASTSLRAKAGTRAPRKISLWVGTTGAFKLWYRGKLALEDAAYRDLDIDRFATTVELGPGDSRVFVKVCGTEDAPKIALRLADERGAPDLGIEVDPGLVEAPPPAPASAKVKDEAKPKPTGVLGPVQIFERETASPKAPPAMLEAYARYLFVSGGDPKGEHKARDLAGRAADAEPTVRRLLLAATLSEDRNQERAWIEKAEALVGAKNDDLRVLLARARLEQSGTNWRDAVPIYERMLTIDPDDVSATLGLVDLYVEAGLKRTALATLEKAVARQPSSVALLRAFAQQLRAVGRDTEAAEAEARYAALRFDDSGYLGQMVDLAAQRRDAAGAERWLERFVRSEPDSGWARRVAARAYRSLGQDERALAAYERARETAPEDVETLRALADLYGEAGRREDQLRLLRQILVVSPQAKDVRQYVEHLSPPRPRVDEAYAWAPEKFLAMRDADAGRFHRRTLRQLAVTTVYANGLASRFHQVVFQPLTNEAAASAREFAFQYDGAGQEVQLRAARAYKKSGRVDEAIESGEAAVNDPSIAMYTSQRIFYVHFAKLDPGDVVELRWRVDDVSPKNEIADYFGEVESLQSDEPIASSEYVLIAPKTRTIHAFVTPLPGLKKDTSDQGELRVMRWSATDVPPILPEPGMPPWAETVGHVHVSTFKTWQDVGRWYEGLAKDQLDVDDTVRRRVREAIKGLTAPEQKVRALYKVVTDLRYVGLELGIEGIRPRRCALTVARGWGDCKDKAALLVAMLREAGIPATMVLVRTGLRGRVEAEPASLAPFDHAIAYVPSLDLYLDGTAELSGSTELPAMDRGAVALRLDAGQPKLVELPQPGPDASVARRKIDVTLGADGSGQFALEATVTGVHAPEWRGRYRADGTRRDRAARDLATDLGPVELATGPQGVETGDLDDVEQTVRFKARGRARAVARREGDALSVPVGPEVHLASDVASLSERTHDVVIPALTTREDEWTLHLPTGMHVASQPTVTNVDGPFGRVSITVEAQPGKVVVKSALALKKPRITPAEYPAFRAFCNEVDRAFGQRLVVRK